MKRGESPLWLINEQAPEALAPGAVVFVVETGGFEPPREHQTTSLLIAS